MTVYTFIQQEEIRETTRETGMESQNKFNRQSIQEIKHKGLCDDIKRRSFESMVGHTTQSGSNSKIKVKIYSIMFLHSKEGQLPMVGSRL